MLSLKMWFMMKSSVRCFGFGLRNISSVSQCPLAALRWRWFWCLHRRSNSTHAAVYPTAAFESLHTETSWSCTSVDRSYAFADDGVRLEILFWVDHAEFGYRAAASRVRACSVVVQILVTHADKTPPQRACTLVGMQPLAPMPYSNPPLDCIMNMPSADCSTPSGRAM